MICKRSQGSQRASALLFVIISLTAMMAVGLMFMNRSSIFIKLSGLRLDRLTAENAMETGMQYGVRLVEVAGLNVRLDSKLQLHPESSISDEEMDTLWDRYGSNPVTALEFLRQSIDVQAYDTSGNPIAGHIFAAGFTEVFPTEFEDPDPTDEVYVQLKYQFNAQQPRRVTTALKDEIFFVYDYTIYARGYGDKSYSQIESSQSGIIEIPVSAAPFSTFALFRSSSRNQNGDILVFAGGNTSAQIQEVFEGPVHVNDAFHFYGHPVFNGPISSGALESAWQQYSNGSYSCCATFNNSKTGGIDPIEMPTEIFSVVRVAAGDPSQTAAIDNTPVTTPELLSFLQYHQGGSFSGGEAEVPKGIYIPTEGEFDSTPKGGVYIEGDAEISLNVIQGQADFHSSYWNQLENEHKACKFQKIKIQSLEAGVGHKDLFIGDEGCEVTYVFNPSEPTSPPAVLAGRINGNIHVNGKIDKLGGESRTRPAIAQDFGFTISAKEDIRIHNDIQYEDVEYKEFGATGELGAETVANSWGEVGGSGYTTTSEDIVATIGEESQTILGLISTHRNVMLHIDAPANVNLHAAIFAGNDAAYDDTTELGCGEDTSSKRGCGFGNEGWDSKTGMGTFKFLGSISEFKSQTMGRLSNPPTGYERRLSYDQRLRQDLMPPAFPLSDDVQAYPRVKHLKTWKISSAEN